MANEGIFYQPPAPTQPAPHVPIAPQGQQPPRRTHHAMMAVVLASWPTGLEYQAPQRAPTVPIPAQGQQPPKKTTHLLEHVVRQSWPTGLEYQAPQRAPTVRIPAQGQQPPRYSPQQYYALVLASWPTGLEYQSPQRAPTVRIPAQGQQPPRWYPQQYFALVDAWRAPDPAPLQLAESVATLPPPVVAAQVPFVRLPDSVLASWLPAEVRPPRAPTAPVPTQGDQPPRCSPAVLYALVDAWRTPDPVPTQRVLLAPIPAQGSQPPRSSPAALYALVDSWRAPDPLPQTPPPRQTVSVDNPPRRAGFVPYPEPDPPAPAQRRTTVPIPAQGDQPPRYSPAALYALVDAWRSLDAAPARRVVAPIPPPVATGQVPFVRLPDAVLVAWSPAEVRPPRPLTVPIPAQGQQPPPFVRLPAWVLASWEPAAPAPQAAPPRQVVSVDNPPRRAPAAAHPEVAPPPSPQTRPGVAPFVTAPTVVLAPRFPWAILDAWTVAPYAVPRPQTLAPLALIYGDQPPRRSDVNAQTIRAAWVSFHPYTVYSPVPPLFTPSGGVCAAFTVGASVNATVSVSPTVNATVSVEAC